jgi:hypothetical protein
VEGKTGNLVSQADKLDAAEISNMAEESALYDQGSITNQSTRGGSGAQTPSPEHGSPSGAQVVSRGSRTWEAPPPAYEESPIHEESTQDGSTSSAISVLLALRQHLGVRALLVPTFKTCSQYLRHPRTAPPTVAEPPVPSTSAEVVDEITVDQSGSESAECAASPSRCGDIGQDTDNVNEHDSNQGTFTSDQVVRILTETYSAL